MACILPYSNKAVGLFTPYEVVESRLLNGLGDAAKVSTGIAVGAGAAGAILATSAGAAVINAGAAAAVSAGLISAGAAAQAVPVVGTIVGAIAIAAGFIAKAQGKAKAIRTERKQIDSQNLELSTLSAELDNNITETNIKRTAIYQALNALGLNKEVSGLSGLLANIFTPAKVESKKLASATDENARLNEEVLKKIDTLTVLKNDFQSLLDKLTKANNSKKNIQTAMILGGSALAIGGLAYLIFSKK